MQKSIRRLALILCASAFALASTAQAGVAETGLKNFKLDMAKASVQKELNKQARKPVKMQCEIDTAVRMVGPGHEVCLVENQTGTVASMNIRLTLFLFKDSRLQSVTFHIGEPGEPNPLQVAGAGAALEAVLGPSKTDGPDMQVWTLSDGSIVNLKKVGQLAVQHAALKHMEYLASRR